jgi:hypothetical protein
MQALLLIASLILLWLGVFLSDDLATEKGLSSRFVTAVASRAPEAGGGGLGTT